ncbi:CDP-alcohol phosphatidyltransferase family protein [Desulfosediminicola sp.]|uniref:CDP-alcohol phosphatidyltransferase family protein n=1 Tax=Desulfosediminicola sp. TaxID=2886825 RepID=UPI003AF2ABAB
MIRLKPVIPSLLSALRLVIALIFPAVPEKYWLWLVVFAAISDVLDGWLARKWQVISWQGALVDAIADKFFVLTVLFVFTLSDRFAVYWIPLVLARDLLVAATAGFLATRGLWAEFKNTRSRPTGKIATGGQFILFVIILAAPTQILSGLILASTCSIVAAFDYGLLFCKFLSTRHSATPKNNTA